MIATVSVRAFPMHSPAFEAKELARDWAESKYAFAETCFAAMELALGVSFMIGAFIGKPVPRPITQLSSPFTWGVLFFVTGILKALSLKYEWRTVRSVSEVGSVLLHMAAASTFYLGKWVVVGTMFGTLGVKNAVVYLLRVRS